MLGPNSRERKKKVGWLLKDSKNDDGGKKCGGLRQQRTGHLNAEIPMNRPPAGLGWLLVRKQLSNSLTTTFLQTPNPPPTYPIQPT